MIVNVIMSGRSKMPHAVSALELEPHDLIREVSRDAINYYVDELSGIHLPDDFKEKYAETYAVKFWKPEDRLRGKFGRFVLQSAQEESVGDEEPLGDILLMGSTIGLRGLDGNYMLDLRHYEFLRKARQILEARDLPDEDIKLQDVDYGSTSIKLRDDGKVAAIRVGGSSMDYGRAGKEGRRETCEAFERLLGNEIEVINSEPEPREHQKIVS
jgi:hypothetical protein